MEERYCDIVEVKSSNLLSRTKNKINTLRSRGVSRPRQSHKLEIVGANPASATNQFLSVAQPGSALRLGRRGPRFESLY